jgi:phosphate transport system substrate-binding protein
MSRHHARPGLRPRRISHPAIAAAAAVIVLALAACTSTYSTTSPVTSASAVAAASPGTGGHPPTLTGSGSTFDAPFFAAAFARYQQQHPGVTISYSAVGSSAGIAAFSARLHLTGPVLAAIYLGQITHWNDPAITALNPGITLPPAAITVVHRSDGSGTTYIFSGSVKLDRPHLRGVDCRLC